MAPVFVLLLSAAAAQAQEATETEEGQSADGFSAGGAVAEETARMGAISVTATRNPIEAFEYPGMVSVVGREELRRLQPSTPDDALKLVPNVEFGGGPRRTGEVPIIRGFSGPDVIVLFDGARQNFNSGHDGRFFIDPFLLESVEVLRGPASALYGSGGTGGIIEFRTVEAADLLAPGETSGVRVTGGVQSVNHEWLGAVTGYATPTDNLDLLASIGRRESGNIHLGDGSTLHDTDDEITAGLAKAGLQLNEDSRIEASFLRFGNEAQEPNNGQNVTEGDEVDKDIVSDTWRLAYDFHQPGNNLFDLDATLYYTEFQADERRLTTTAEGPAGEMLKRDVDTIGMRFDNRSRAMFGESIGTVFTYGVEAYRDDQNGEQGGGDRPGVPDAQAEFYGIFGQAEITISEPFGAVPGELLIIPGLRYDHFKSTSGLAEANKDSEVSPRVGVSYLPADWLLLFGSYSEAFRAPTFDETYLTGVHFVIPGFGTNFFIPNPDLKPQRISTWEAGLGFEFHDLLARNDLFQIKGSHFWIDGRDFITLSVDQPGPPACFPPNCNGTTNSANLPHAELHGTEVEASYESDRFLFNFGYGDIRGHDEDSGDNIDTLTPDTWTFEAGVKVHEINSLVGWRTIFAERFTEVDEESEERDSYIVNDLFYAWQPVDGPLAGIRVDLGIDNIFDENYERVFAGVPEAGRNYKALVSYSLNW